MKELPSIISQIVDSAAIKPSNKEKIKSALLITIREIIYNGSEIQKKYLRNLSNTYSVLFLVQCDPQVTTYFNSLASKLMIFVGTSIIIPALSEYYLKNENKRFWNLLKGAHALGVNLVINDSILDELIDHF